MIQIKFLKKENRAIAFDNEKEIGFCEFSVMDNCWNIIHTIVFKKYQGLGIAKKLVECVVKKAKENNVKLKADCSYANKILMR